MNASIPDQVFRFGHYQVMADAAGRPVKLGEGAMGVTYLAEDTNLRMKVALKVIAPNLLGDSEIMQRFQREAQAAARLRHPNVAAVYHLGMIDDTFFYTMEFVEGRTLREQVADTGPLDIKQALQVALQMCDALSAAERHLMVHRDIKPANIMLEKTDDGPRAKLIDFGLAKPLEQDAQQTSALLTLRGTFLGTAVFASPEQVQDLPLDTRSDFYALGLTLWFMLEGRPPFEGTLHKVLYDQVHTLPPLDRLMWVPAELRKLLEMLLAKQPESRPQTSRELRQLIQDCLRAVGSTNTSKADWQQRFQVTQAPRQEPWGSTYEGQDTLSGAVWLHFLRSDRFQDAETLNRLLAGGRRAIEISHPNVLRHLTLFPTNDSGDAGWIIVTEHPGPHTLLEHLRKEKQLSTSETLSLIKRIADGLDCCISSELLDADLDPGRIYLKPQSPVGGNGPVEVVPKFCPLNYNLPLLRSSRDAAVADTQIMPRLETRNPQDAVQRLAALAHRCMGGSKGRAGRYSLLPGLTPAQNQVLDEALVGRKYSKAADFVTALEAAFPPTAQGERKAPAPAKGKGVPSPVAVNAVTYAIVLGAVGFVSILAFGLLKKTLSGPDEPAPPPAAEKTITDTASTGSEVTANEPDPTAPENTANAAKPVPVEAAMTTTTPPAADSTAAVADGSPNAPPLPATTAAMSPAEAPPPSRTEPADAPPPALITTTAAPAPAMATLPPVAPVQPPPIPAPIDLPAPAPPATMARTGAMPEALEQPVQDPAELERFKQDVLNRIDEANQSAFSEDMKNKARQMVHDLVHLQRVDTLHFAQKLDLQQEAESLQRLHRHLEAPAVVAQLKSSQEAGLIVLGYADSVTGSKRQNHTLSEQRAKKICDIVREACPDVETIVSFGVGETQLVGADKKSRAVEIWLAVPRQ